MIGNSRSKDLFPKTIPKFARMRESCLSFFDRLKISEGSLKAQNQLSLQREHTAVVGQFESECIFSGRFAGHQMVSTTRPAKA